MVVTPLINKITNRNGTFIAFQSAVNDSNLINGHQGYKFSFSKYALIKIPEITKASAFISEPTVSDKNFLNLDAIGDSLHTGSQVSASFPVSFAESFQNYCLNFESIIINSVSKTSMLNANVSEEIFFKWLKETGAIVFEDADGTLSRVSNRWVESEELDDSEYSRVVKYINEISSVNVTTDDSVYTELYIYTPTDHGQTPHVLFTSGENELYSKKSGKIYSAPSDFSQDTEYILGRNSHTIHPDNLQVTAIYDADRDTGSVICKIKENSEDEWVDGHWYDRYDAVANDSTVKDCYIVDQIGENKNEYIQKINEESSASTVYRRSSLDGIKIDWNVSESYKLGFVTDEDMENYTLNEFNNSLSGNNREFDFNAVLVYYDLTDSNNNSKSYLYGIYFLDGVPDASIDTNIVKIPSVTKYKSNTIDTVEGNALAYKINLRTDTSLSNITNIGTSTGSRNFSMDLFNEALSAMKVYTDTFNGKMEFITNLYDEVIKLRNLFVDDQNKDEIIKRIENIEETISNVKSSLFDSGSGINLTFIANIEAYINDLYSKYSKILENKTPIKIEYDYNQAKLNSLVTHNQEYNINPESYSGDIFSSRTLKLLPFSNYFKYEKYDEDGESVYSELTEDIEILIDDSEEKWIAGQRFRINFSTPVAFEGQAVNIVIRTDSKNISNSGGAFKAEIARLTEDDFNYDFNGGKPIIEIICINPNTMQFTIDKIR